MCKDLKKNRDIMQRKMGNIKSNQTEFLELKNAMSAEENISSLEHTIQIKTQREK